MLLDFTKQLEELKRQQGWDLRQDQLAYQAQLQQQQMGAQRQHREFLARQLASTTKKEIEQLAAIEIRLIKEEIFAPRVPKFEIPSFRQGRPPKPSTSPPSFKVPGFKGAPVVDIQEPSPQCL